jgi:hypothetical protein
LLKHHDVFRQDKNDIGLATNLKHRIDLQNKDPTYVKQFTILDAHRDKLENQDIEWLKMGLIQPSRSKYISLFFIVPEKDRSLRSHIGILANAIRKTIPTFDSFHSPRTGTI